jgi:C1A family cysteine protease
MKIFSMLILVFAIAVIFAVDNSNSEQQNNQLMTKEEVIDLISRGYHETRNDKGYSARIKNLMPLQKQIKIDYPKKKINFEALPEDVDMRKYATDVRSQGNEGTCTAFGEVAAQESSHCALNGACGLDLSERQRWNMYKQPYIDQALANIKKPIALEADCPYKKKTCPSTVVKKSIYKVEKTNPLTTKEEVLEALARGKQVYFWSQVPSQMANCARTISSSEMVNGGHAYLVTGYFSKDDPVLILKNSWGTECGDAGWQYMQFSIFDKEGYWGAHSIESTKIL